MPPTISQIEKEIVSEFEMFDDWMDKYQYIIEMGQELKGLPDSEKRADNLVRGCQSQVWLVGEMEGDKVRFQADSDAIITKGLIALLIRVLSGHTPEEIAQARLEFVDQIGIREHLSPTRSNGLLAMIKKMKYFAIAFQAGHNN
jgi:cysteine desulfuration protein SufE